MTGQEVELRQILAWAGDHYPTRANPPPELFWIGPDDIVALFEQCPSRIAHLALVDQGRSASDAALAAWQRYRRPEHQWTAWL